MDIELLHTFLEVDQARHFGRAAEKLCVTQAAVSARIKLLETTLGTRLFARARNNIRLTAAGEALKPHAESIVQAWQRIRGTPRRTTPVNGALSIGCSGDIGALLLPDWFAALRARATGGLHSLADNTGALLRLLEQRALDLVLTLAAPDTPDLDVRELADVELVLMSTSKRHACERALAAGYVYVDWGDWFRARHDGLHPVTTREGTSTDSAMLAATLLLRGAGAAYLPRRLLTLSTWSRRLHPVADAPAVTHPLYAVLPAGAAQDGRIEEALTLARALLRSPSSAASGRKRQVRR